MVLNFCFGYYMVSPAHEDDVWVICHIFSNYQKEKILQVLIAANCRGQFPIFSLLKKKKKIILMDYCASRDFFIYFFFGCENYLPLVFL